MVGSASGQDEATPVHRLATRAGKMGLARSGLSVLFPKSEKLRCILLAI